MSKEELCFKCFVEGCERKAVSDLARLQSQLASMDDLTSTKWGRALKKTRGSLDPANCYACDGKLFPRACRTHTKTALKKIGNREVKKENRVGGFARCCYFRSPVTLILVVLLAKQKARKAAVRNVSRFLDAM